MVLREKPAEQQPEGHFDDRSMETIMGRLLQIGVLLASFVMLVGGLLYVRAHHEGVPDYRVFKGEPQALRHIGGVMSGVKVRRASRDHSVRGASTDCDAGGAGDIRADCLRD